MISNIGHKVVKYSSIVVFSILGFFILFLMFINLAIRQQNVQNLVERYSNEYINAKIKADTIEIHLLRDFPYASLSVKNCRIKSMAFEALDSTRHALVPSKADSLANIGSLNISISLIDLLFNNLEITGIELESPQIYGYTSQFGINNWDILKTDTNSVNDEDSTSFGINIKKISIKNGAQISLCNASDSTNLDLVLNELTLKGKLSSNLNESYISKAILSRLVLTADHFNEGPIDSILDNSMKLSVDSLNIIKKHRSNIASIDIRARTDMEFHGITMANNVPFDLRGEIRFEDLLNGDLGIDLEKLTLYAATLPITMKGNLILSDSGINIPDLKGYIDKYNIKNILDYIPEYFLVTESIETDAAITLSADIKGKYQFVTGELPAINISFSIPRSTIKINDKKNNTSQTIDNFETAISLKFDQNCAKNNTLTISKLILEGSGISINVNGNINEYTDDPLIDIKAESNFNLDTLSAIIPMDMIARGSAKGSFSLKGRASDLNLFSIYKNSIEGKFFSDSLILKIPGQGIDFNCGKISLYTGILKNDRDTLLTKGNKIFCSTISIDTLHLNYKDSLQIFGSKVALSANQEPVDTKQKNKKHAFSSAIKFDGKLNMNGLSFIGSDSSRFRLRRLKSSFSITPWKDGKTPVLALNAGIDGTSLIQSGSRLNVLNSNFAIKIITHYPKRANRDTTMIHSSKQATYSDTTHTHSFSSKRLIRRILRNWDINGSIKASRGRVITPYFPLRTRFFDIDISLSNDGIHFQDSKFTFGNSSIILSGKLEGFTKAVTDHQKLSFTGSVFSDSLDINQIIQVSGNSKDISMADGRSDDAIENAMEKALNSDTSSMKAPTIPGFLIANIKLNLNNVAFKEKILKSIQGNLIARNSIFQLNNFKILTEFGKIDLNAFYAAKQIDDVSIGFDLKMNKFEISDLIEFIPNVDSLLPMIKSFKGEITCTLSAMTKLDSLLNVQMDKINGICTFEGENVILMDGETFAEIAKALKFKNREKNFIDRISMQCVASDNKIEIFPFVIEMDRYKAAVSGTQNMDMSFLYHISVLKSPIPFRIGLNISGTTENMKFKVGKCMYKNENVPIYSQIIDSARINLGEQIKEIFLRGAKETIVNGNTRKLVKFAKEEQKKTSNMEDLSNNELQKLDSKDLEK